MAEVAPEVLDLLEQVRQKALSYDDTEEHFTWGTRTFFRGMKGRNFLFTNEIKDQLEIIFRVPKGQREQLLAEPFIDLHKHMGERGWVSARVKTQEELDKALPWIEISYELNKLFRSKADLLPGETPEVLDFLEQVRQAAMRYEDIEEFFPFGDRAFRPRKGQIFLYAGEGDDHLYINVRLPLGEREYALSLPFVDVPKYIGHKGWVGAKVGSQEELDIVFPWIDASYEMNRPARKRRAKKLAEKFD